MIQTLVLSVFLWHATLTAPVLKKEPEKEIEIHALGLFHPIEKLIESLTNKLGIFKNFKPIGASDLDYYEELTVERTYFLKNLCAHGFESVKKQCPKISLSVDALCQPANINNLLLVSCHDRKGSLNGGGEEDTVRVIKISKNEPVNENLLVNKNETKVEEVKQKNPLSEAKITQKLPPSVHTQRKDGPALSEFKVRVLKVLNSTHADKEYKQEKKQSVEEKEDDGTMFDIKDTNAAFFFNNYKMFGMVVLVIGLVKLAVIMSIFVYVTHKHHKKRGSDKNNESSDINEETKRGSFIESSQECLQQPI